MGVIQLIKLLESNTPKVGGYMLSRWDEVIPVKYHPYGETKDDIDSITNNVSCAWFLYKYCKRIKSDLESIFINYICYCVDYLADTLDYADLDAEGDSYKNLLYQIFEECDVDNCLNNWNYEEIDIKKSTASLPDVIKRNLIAVVENQLLVLCQSPLKLGDSPLVLTLCKLITTMWKLMEITPYHLSTYL